LRAPSISKDTKEDQHRSCSEDLQTSRRAGSRQEIRGRLASLASPGQQKTHELQVPAQSHTNSAQADCSVCKRKVPPYVSSRGGCAPVHVATRTRPGPTLTGMWAAVVLLSSIHFCVFLCAAGSQGIDSSGQCQQAPWKPRREHMPKSIPTAGARPIQSSGRSVWTRGIVNPKSLRAQAIRRDQSSWLARSTGDLMINTSSGTREIAGLCASLEHIWELQFAIDFAARCQRSCGSDVTRYS
jgi:hypothetical protein